MDGGGRRDVRKQRVEGVFYGAIGREANGKKKRGIERRKNAQRGENRQTYTPGHEIWEERGRGGNEKRGCDDEEHERKEENEKRQMK